MNEKAIQKQQDCAMTYVTLVLCDCNNLTL